MNITKWCLLKGSDIGPMGRGQQGKKKMYEITVTENVLECSWGMAEKPQRRNSRVVFSSHQAALAAGYTKLYEKRERGYEVAYQV